MTIIKDIKNIRIPDTKLPVMNCIKKRFSPHIFSSSLVLKNDLEIIFEAARLTPSARNYQPWFFYYVEKETLSYEKLFTCIPEMNFWSKTAPVIIIACYNSTDPNGEINKWANYDLGASVISLILQATELNYSCRQMGLFDADKIKTEFSIPDPFLPFTLIALGKMGGEEDYQKADKETVEKDLLPNPKKDKIFQEL
jgi:nitroreductase